MAAAQPGQKRPIGPQDNDKYPPKRSRDHLDEPSSSSDASRTKIIPQASQPKTVHDRKAAVRITGWIDTVASLTTKAMKIDIQFLVQAKTLIRERCRELITSIPEVTYKDLLEAYKKRYNPENDIQLMEKITRKDGMTSITRFGTVSKDPPAAPSTVSVSNLRMHAAENKIVEELMKNHPQANDNQIALARLEIRKRFDEICTQFKSVPNLDDLLSAYGASYDMKGDSDILDILKKSREELKLPKMPESAPKDLPIFNPDSPRCDEIDVIDTAVDKVIKQLHLPSFQNETLRPHIRNRFFEMYTGKPVPKFKYVIRAYTRKYGVILDGDSELRKLLKQ